MCSRFGDVLGGGSADPRIDDPYRIRVVLNESYRLVSLSLGGRIRYPNRRVRPPMQPTCNIGVVVADTRRGDLANHWRAPGAVAVGRREQASNGRRASWCCTFVARAAFGHLKPSREQSPRAHANARTCWLATGRRRSSNRH
jgi:hypothetical protein